MNIPSLHDEANYSHQDKNQYPVSVVRFLSRKIICRHGFDELPRAEM